MSHPPMKRRDFARLFAFGSSAALLGHPSFEGFRPGPLLQLLPSPRGRGLERRSGSIPDAAVRVGPERR